MASVVLLSLKKELPGRARIYLLADGLLSPGRTLPPGSTSSCAELRPQLPHPL